MAGMLEQIAQKEQELRVRLIAARAQADALVAEAQKQATEVRSTREAAARTEVQEWLAAELDRAHTEADQLVSDANSKLGNIDDLDARREAAVQLLLNAIVQAT